VYNKLKKTQITYIYITRFSLFKMITYVYQNLQNCILQILKLNYNKNFLKKLELSFW